MSIDSVILVGGQGTRLQSVLKGLPKPLAPLRGRPFLDIIIKQLKNFRAISKVILAVGYKAQAVIDAYSRSNDFTFPIEFSVEDSPLGTGGAMKKAFLQAGSETILAMNGDSYAEFDLEAFLAFHKSHGGDVSLLLASVDDVSRFGEVMFEPASGRITDFQEKSTRQEPGFINAGIYLMKNNIFEGLPGEAAFSFEKDSLPRLIQRGIYGYPSSGKFIDIGIPETYGRAEEYLGELL
jgi:NDP-sugar pyrophosphorylase family protein